MATKTYGQMCPVARSLDVLGERWTLLVVRELLLGPKRFKHLLADFPSLGGNRLTTRLRDLEAAGVVQRSVLPEPAEVTVYELTPRGEALREPLLALGRWGLTLPVDERIDPATLRADLIALSLTGLQVAPLDPSRVEDLQFDVGAERFHLQLRGGRYVARTGTTAATPVLHVECDLSTLLALAVRTTSTDAALADGSVVVHRGSSAALREVFDVLVLEHAPSEPSLQIPHRGEGGQK